MTARPDTPPDPLPEELFLRYWDDVLTDAEAAVLAERLRTDPAARERFESLCFQFGALAECRPSGGRPLDAAFAPDTIERGIGRGAVDDVGLAHPSREELEAFGLGRLDPGPEAGVLRHLEGCAACRAVVESLPDDTLSALVRRAVTSAYGVTNPTPPRPVPEPGDPLAGHPRYRVLGPVGAGGMGVVYRAEHLLMGRVVALKVLHRQLTEWPAVIERFRREVQAAAGLSHPNIVAALDADQAGDRHFLVMEYVEGTTLARLVNEHGPLPPESACEYARQAAMGLQHAHGQGLVHRDIKPANLMLTPDGWVKVLDFGLVRLGPDADGGVTAADTLLGSVDFLAPEQADDPRTADTRADIYSLGCTLYFLLTGRPPFAGGNLIQRLKAHALREPPPLEDARPDLDFPRGLERVVRKMLAKDPARRFRTPADVAEALAPFADPARAEDAKLRRRKHVFRLLLGVLLALGAAVYWVVTDYGEVEITTNDPFAQVVLERNGKPVRVLNLQTIVTAPDLETRLSGRLTLRAGVYAVRVENSASGPVEIQPNLLVVRRGGKSTLAIKRGLVRAERFEAPERFRALAVSADGRFAVAGGGADGRRDPSSSRGFITLWHLRTEYRVERVDQFQVHGHVVTDLTFTRDAGRFLSCGSDGTARLWDVATRKEIRQYKGHGGDVRAASITPDDRFVLTGCQDKKLRLFDLETREEKKVLTGHVVGVVCVAFAPDGRRVLSADEGGTVHLWDLDKGQQIRSWGLDHWPCRLAWLGDGRRFLTCGDRGRLLLWDVDTDQPVRSYEGHGHQVCDVARTADERFVVSASRDGTVRFWDLNTGQEMLRHTAQFGAIDRLGLAGHGRMLLTLGGFHNYQVADLYHLPLGLWPAKK
jgi:hypothetical protein